MKLFSKQEMFVVLLILFFIGFISFFNFRVSLRRGRDNERKNDISDIGKMLDDYKSHNSIYPSDLSSLAKAPKDPGTPSGHSYLYLTDGKYYQLYASLEGGADEMEYSSNIFVRNLKCGKFICNFGKASGNAPLDKTLEEYENELYVKSKK